MLKPVYLLSLSAHRLLFRAFSALKTQWTADLGRCPRLLDFAPLALRAGVFTPPAVAGRLILRYQSPGKSEINRPLPQAVLTRSHVSSYCFDGTAGANLRS